MSSALEPRSPEPSKSLRTLTELMGEIATIRAEIASWKNALFDLHQRIKTDILPLEKKSLEIRVETFRTLGRHLQAGHLAKRDRKILELALLDFARELEDRFEVDLTLDRRRYLDSDYFPRGEVGDEEVEAEEEEEEKEEIEREGPWGQDQDAQASSHTHTYRESDFQHDKRNARVSKKDSAKSKTESNQEPLAGDIRALYLMLARALHPDKESDPSRRDEKTAWMQKVAAAYANRNLAGLLDILARNPMEAIGPYLFQAPMKTVSGFTKRLRRDLISLQGQLQALKAPTVGLDPFFVTLIRDGKIVETAYARYFSEVKKEVKFMKQRRESYATTHGLQALIEALRIHEWHQLM